MSIVKSAFAKTTVSGVAALGLVGTLCYLAITGGVDSGQFLAAVVSGPVFYLFGKQSNS